MKEKVEEDDKSAFEAKFREGVLKTYKTEAVEHAKHFNIFWFGGKESDKE